MRESGNERKTDGEDSRWIEQADSPGIRNVILARRGDIIALVCLEAAP